MKVTVTTEVTDERVKDLLCCAWEGGSNSWASANGSYEQAFEDGGVVLTDATGEDTGPDQPWILDRAAIAKGLQLMAEKFPRNWADFMGENEDADTGDTFLQLCLFGEVVFG